MGLSLEEAIRGKYCCGKEAVERAGEVASASRLVKEAAVYLRPGMNCNYESL